MPPRKTNRKKDGRGAPKGNQRALGHGAPEGNQNAAKHGIWSKAVSPELLAVADGLAEIAKGEKQTRASDLFLARILKALDAKDTPLDAISRGFAAYKGFTEDLSDDDGDEQPDESGDESDIDLDPAALVQRYQEEIKASQEI